MAKVIDTRLHKLKYWRSVANLKQADMALLIGCTDANYNMKENGKTEIRRNEMLIAQKAINDRLVKTGKEPVTLDEIFLP